MNVLDLIGRKNLLFEDDIRNFNENLKKEVSGSRFLVIGGAGSIGQAVVKEIFKRSPKLLHVVDISENNMVELVRELRSTLGYIEGEFKTFCIDCGGIEFEALMQASKGYDYVLNLSALKHVRSEKDDFTLMRMIDVNITHTIKIAKLAKECGAKKYFCVSTDKAANPVNMMGASKRIMELFLMRESADITISTARFANVAFSDGSLLHGFNQRYMKRQPISAPNDVKRYFVTPEEAGQLCLISCILGDNREILFPKMSEVLHLTTFSAIAESYLQQLGFQPYLCETEQEARDRAVDLIENKKWPCYFFQSDTSGEKDAEEFFMTHETLDMERFKNIGIVKNNIQYEVTALDIFEKEISEMRKMGRWSKKQIVSLFNDVIPEFQHLDVGKYLDGKM